MVIGKNFLVLLLIVLVFVFCTAIVFAPDPVPQSFNELGDISDAIVIATVNSSQSSKGYMDLSSKYFDETELRLRVVSSFKGNMKTGELFSLTTYQPNGKGGIGNFGSHIKIDSKDNDVLHLLFLKREDARWIPSSGYMDGGNSHFLLQCSGIVRTR